MLHPDCENSHFVKCLFFQLIELIQLIHSIHEMAVTFGLVRFGLVKAGFVWLG